MIVNLIGSALFNLDIACRNGQLDNLEKQFGDSNEKTSSIKLDNNGFNLIVACFLILNNLLRSWFEQSAAKYEARLFKK